MQKLLGVLLLWHMYAISLVESLTFHIAPSANVQCPNTVDNCTTLSAFMADWKNWTSESISLILLHGHHSLDQTLVVSNVLSFSMMSESHTHIKTVIRCNNSVGIKFYLVSSVHIGDIDLINCVKFKVNSVDNFTIHNVTYRQALNIKGSALILNMTNAHLIRSSFFNFCGTTWENCKTQLVGGAIIALLSTVRISDCMFRNNSAELGGAIYAEQWSYVSIVHSTFVDHSTSCKEKCFGNILFFNTSDAKIIGSTFSNNTFNHSKLMTTRGGVIGSLESNISTQFSVFLKNFAYMGAVIESRHSTVEFYKCNFSQNTAKLNGGVGLFKTSSIFISKCYFSGSVASEKAGGVFYIHRSKLKVSESHFESNQAFNLGGAARISKSKVFINKSTFTANKVASETGRGGAMYYADKNYAELGDTYFLHNKAYAGGAISVNTGSTAYLKEANLFVQNSAHYGGAIQVQFSTFTCNGSFTVFHNRASWGVFIFLHSDANISGKFDFKYNLGSLLSFGSEIITSGSIHFKNNTPENLTIHHPGVTEGGAITSILSTVTLQGNVRFTQNTAVNGGGLLAVSSRILISGRFSATKNYASDTGGGIYVYHSEIHVIRCQADMSQNWALNKGGGIHFVGSSLVLVTRNQQQSNISFCKNFAKKGGGVCMEENSKFYTATTNPVIYFIDNAAEYGGAIYVSDDTNNGACTSSKNTVTTTSESDCFFQFVQYSPYNFSKPIIIEDHIKFSGDSANISGAILYGGLLDRCTINIFERKAYAKIQYSSQPHFINSKLLNYTASDAVRVCFCQHSEAEVDCSFQPDTIQVMKGRKFSLNVAAVDHVNHTLTDITIHSYMSHKDSRLGKGQKVQRTYSLKCSVLTFQAYTMLDKEVMVVFPEGPCKSAKLSQRQISIEFHQCVCPVGFEPSHLEEDLHTCKCKCHSKLEKFVTKCDASTSTINRKGEVWITAFNHTGTTDFFIHPHCPFDYCYPPTMAVRINLTLLNGSNAQCNHNRSGILCSVCKPGLSLSLGSSRCIRCPEYWPALLIVITISAMLAGALLVCFVMAFNLTVAVGTLNGLVFYANIMGANKSIFLPFEIPNFHSVVISWLNLDIGFNACYFEGMDAYGKAWIEFLFSIYVISVVAGVILICKYSSKFSSLLGKRNPVATLATLILLSYAKLLQSIITVVSFTILKYPNGTTEVVWRPDASVKYFSGKHIPLFLAATIILFIGIVYTILLFSWQWLLLVSDMKLLKWVTNTKVTSFMDAYHAPYTPKNRYWTGLLLLARVILYIVSALNVSGEPSTNLISVSVVVTSLFVLKFNVYKKWPVDILETVLYVNLILLSAGKFYILYNQTDNHALLAYISTSISIFILGNILIYHIVCSTPIKDYWSRCMKHSIIGRPKLSNENLTTNLLDNEDDHCSCDYLDPEVTFTVVQVDKPVLCQLQQSSL